MRLLTRWFARSPWPVAVSIQPCQRPLYDPTAWKDHETLGGIGPFDDLEGLFADPAQRLSEFVASIAAIGKRIAQPREALDDLGQHSGAPSRSWMSAVWITAWTRLPSVSVKMWRLRPLIFLPAK